MIIEQPTDYSATHVGIYHADCFDGVAAAWVLMQQFPGIVLIAADYRESPPWKMIRDKVVYVVDFTYKPADMLQMTEAVKKMVVIDHHPRAVELVKEVDGYSDSDLRSLDFVGISPSRMELVVDTKRSGAHLTWDYFHAGEARPDWLDAVGYRDLWQFHLPGTKEIAYGLALLDLTPEAWGLALEEAGNHVAFSEQLLAWGRPVARKVEKDIDRIIAQTERRVTFHVVTETAHLQYNVPLINCPRSHASEALARFNRHHPFSAAYYDDATHRIFSLRGNGVVDVGKVAQQFGGDGHFNAAGFSVPRDHPLAKL